MELADINRISERIRNNLIAYMDAIKKPSVGRVVVSTGGIDSSALVVAGLEAGHDVQVCSFTLDDRQSADFKSARKLADYFKLDFKPVFLPSDPDRICNEVIRYMTNYKVRGKSNIECVYPVAIQISELSKKTHYVSGLWADGHFCLSKKGMIHYRSTKELFQRFRYEYFFKLPHQQRSIFARMARDRDMAFHEPYWSTDFYKILTDLNWEQANRPRQKEVLRAAFPELDSLAIKNHTNLHLGDSGIAEAIRSAMLKKYSPGSKSAVSAYNSVVRMGIVKT
jgi:asparagine synthetase B (glutamine-hydrolysing)